MAGKTVAVTGCNGYVGCHIVDQLFKAVDDYKVRLIVRSPAKGEERLRYHAAAAADRISYIVVDDMYSVDAYAKAFAGTDFVIHAASPYTVSTDNPQRDILDPAVQLTTAVLEAARSAGTVKRVVITGSFAAVRDPVDGVTANRTYTEKDWNTKTVEQALKESPVECYEVSKALAEKAAWKFIEEKEPQFDLVVFNPVIIYGKPLQQITSPFSLNLSLQLLYAVLLAPMVPPNPLPFAVDVVDVAKLHVQALTTPKASNQRYLMCSSPCSWYDVLRQIPRKHPELAARVFSVAADAGTPDLTKTKIDCSKILKDFPGFTFKSVMQSIVDETVSSLVDFEKSYKPEDLQAFGEWIQTLG